MKKSIALLVAILIQGCATNHQPYYAVGVGYKVHEANVKWWDAERQSYTDGNSPISARIELGMDAGDFRYGVSHHSQWLSGKPFNDKGEYYKTEFFIDYVKKFNLK